MYIRSFKWLTVQSNLQDELNLLGLSQFNSCLILDKTSFSLPGNVVKYVYKFNIRGQKSGSEAVRVSVEKYLLSLWEYTVDGNKMDFLISR